MPTKANAHKAYDIVFSVGDLPAYWWAPLAPLLGVVVGLALIWLARRVATRRTAMRALGWFLVVASVAWSTVAGVWVFGEWRALRDAQRTGTYRVVEGPIEDFKAMPPTEKGRETFRVRGVEFSVSDFEMTSGFHTTSYRKGPIRQGLDVRITYFPYKGQNLILRLEVAR